MRLAQTPDRRVRRIWLPGLLYVGLCALAMVIAWPYGDAAQVICMTSGIILLPFVCMAVLKWTYAERIRRPEKTKQHVPGEKLEGVAESQSRFPRKVIVGLMLTLPFLFTAGAVCVEALTTTRFGGVLPSALMAAPFAAVAGLLGWLAIRDMLCTGKPNFGLMPAIFCVLVLPLALLNSAVILFALNAAGALAP